MKKYLLLTVIAVLFVALPTQAGLKWGLKAGVNLSDISTDLDYYKDTKNYTGFQVGPMMEFTVPIIGIGMDAALLYSQTGFKANDETIKNGDLLLPVNLKYKLSLLNVIGAYATAGPYIGVKLYSDDKFSVENISAQVESKSFKAGLNFGLGVELLGKLQIGANYQLGLTDDYSTLKIEDQLIPNLDIDGKTQVWSITAAYFF